MDKNDNNNCYCQYCGHEYNSYIARSEDHIVQKNAC